MHGRSACLLLAVAFLPASPLWAGSISMGPQAMEGNLRVMPGVILSAGYDLTVPGSHPAETVQLVGPTVVFHARCISGGGGDAIVLPLAGDPLSIPQGSSAWFPSGDQHSSLVYQGWVAVPDLCNGGEMSLSQGGVFTADLQATDTSHSVHVRWHYSANGTSGSWSGTGGFMPDPLEDAGGPQV
jgi:hypothetical protein